jgi:SH3-like domain-containing protein
MKASIIAACLLLTGALAARAETIYVDEAKARVRSGPGTEYSVLWEAPRYSPLELLAKYKDWYAVRDFQKDVGWIHQGAAAKGKAAVVTQAKVSVHKSPDHKSPVAYTVEKHYLFKVLEDRGSWLRVKDADGEEGWILEKMVWVSR